MGFVLSLVLQMVLGILAMIPGHVVFAPAGIRSRCLFCQSVRKGRDDLGVAGHRPWVNRAQAEYTTQDPLVTFKISGKTGGVMRLFASHPSMEDRIAALERFGSRYERASLNG